MSYLFLSIQKALWHSVMPSGPPWVIQYQFSNPWCNLRWATSPLCFHLLTRDKGFRRMITRPSALPCCGPVIPLQISGGAEEQWGLGNLGLCWRLLIMRMEYRDDSAPAFSLPKGAQGGDFKDPTGNGSLVSLLLSTPSALITVHESHDLHFCHP